MSLYSRVFVQFYVFAVTFHSTKVVLWVLDYAFSNATAIQESTLTPLNFPGM